jgi:hypothetical protein
MESTIKRCIGKVCCHMCGYPKNKQMDDFNSLPEVSHWVDLANLSNATYELSTKHMNTMKHGLTWS